MTIGANIVCRPEIKNFLTYCSTQGVTLMENGGEVDQSRLDDLLDAYLGAQA